MPLEDDAAALTYLRKYSKAKLRDVGFDNVGKSARRFSAALERLAAFTSGGVEAVIRKTCLDLYKRIVQRTPVDTGRARASWGISNANKGDLAPKGFNDRGRGESARGMEEVNKKIQGFMYEIIGDEVIIYNNVEYIEVLENGHSRQAPAGMVSVSLAEFARHLEDNFSKLGW